jgi:holliday junction DNA helicase RuvB
MLSNSFRAQLGLGVGAAGGGHRGRGPKVKRGDEILAGPYPKSFSEFIGQTTAVSQIMASITTSLMLKQPMDHILLASGQPGVGKTALSRLIASNLGAGMVELSGLVTDKDAAAAIKVMQDGDVLFLDEIHRLFANGKARAEWLLTLLQDGELHMPTGVVVAPKITVIAATTDREKLPQTILDRFTTQPILAPYTLEEGVRIAISQAKRLGFGGEHLPMPASNSWLAAVSRATKQNPRRTGQLLATVRDVSLSSKLSNLDDDGYDISVALKWNGLTEDGITRVGQDYLVGLLAYGGTAGISTLKALLGEELLTHTERELIQDGYVEITPRGRMLTDFGTARADRLHSEMEYTA